MDSTLSLEKRLRQAVRYFWETRTRQARNQGSKTGARDAGARAAVTGGAQMDGFVELVKRLIYDKGVPEAGVYRRRRVELPGWYRPEKQWDLLIVTRGELISSLEFKSHVGSFGNNYNNRTEEALGSATDLLAAYRGGAFKPSARPWLGYLMLLEETPRSLAPIRSREPPSRYFLSSARHPTLSVTRFSLPSCP